MYRIIDLSVSHHNGATEPYPPVIKHLDHAAGAHRMAELAGLEPDDFSDTMALATEIISGSGHSGTHIDAPLHFGPSCEGKPAKSIDRVPLEWCFGPGVVLDMRHKAPGSEITTPDMRDSLAKIKYSLHPGNIVLIHTGCDKYWGTDTETYLKMQSGLGVSGLDWLLDQGIRCIGIDAWTLDRPLPAMVEIYKQTGDRSHLWPAHMHGRKREYLHIEKLANLDCLPKPYGFLVSALPVKLEGATGGWCRAVAIFLE